MLSIKNCGCYWEHCYWKEGTDWVQGWSVIIIVLFTLVCVVILFTLACVVILFTLACVVILYHALVHVQSSRTLCNVYACDCVSVVWRSMFSTAKPRSSHVISAQCWDPPSSPCHMHTCKHKPLPLFSEETHPPLLSHAHMQAQAPPSIQCWDPPCHMHTCKHEPHPLFRGP